MPYVYLTQDEIVNFNRSVIGGAPAIINAANLQEAVEGPQRILYGQEVYPTLSAKAAKLVMSLSQGHPFADGNKRTAEQALRVFVKKNRSGRDLTGKPNYLIGRCADAHPIPEEELVIALAKIIPAQQGNEPA